MNKKQTSANPIHKHCQPHCHNCDRFLCMCYLTAKIANAAYAKPGIVLH